MLNVIEIFRSIQGEGPSVGKPAIFIRLAGCPIKCSFCDTDYITNSRKMDELAIVKEVEKLGKGIVVITGGEPIIQNIQNLVIALHQKYKVHLETSGANLEEAKTASFARFEEIVCSPKTAELHHAMKKHTTAWKYLVNPNTRMDEDGIPKGIAKPLNDAPVFIQPIWSDDEEQRAVNNLCALTVVLEHGFRLSLQTHKYLGVE